MYAKTFIQGWDRIDDLVAASHAIPRLAKGITGSDPDSTETNQTIAQVFDLLMKFNNQTPL